MTARLSSKANPYLTRYVKQIRAMHAHGFTVDIVAEIALAGQPAHPEQTPEERELVRKLYVDALPKRLRP